MMIVIISIFQQGKHCAVAIELAIEIIARVERLTTFHVIVTVGVLDVLMHALGFD